MRAMLLLVFALVLSGCGDNGTDTPPATQKNDTSPIVEIIANSTYGPAPLTIKFYGFYVAPNGTSSLLWTFGDGQTSSLQEISHTYTKAGTYTTTLKVVDGIGQSASKNTTITVL